MEKTSHMPHRPAGAPRRLLRALLIALIALLISEALWQKGLLDAAERFYSDLWLRNAGQRHPVERGGRHRVRGLAPERLCLTAAEAASPRPCFFDRFGD